jgi:glycine oxidase
MSDVIIVGGGVIGLSVAFELASRGIDVEVLDQSLIGQEASWAGAGMLPPGNPILARTPEARLRAASHALWPTLTARLADLTGIDNGFRRCGGLELCFHDDQPLFQAEMRHWREEGVAIEELDTAALLRCEPNLSRRVQFAYRLPEMGQVRNPRHLKALVAGCGARGVKLRPGTPVVGFERNDSRVTGVQTPEGTVAGDRILVAGGAWSQRILAELNLRIEVEPVRGQMVLLNQLPLPFTHVLNCGPRYLVPRPDGRILVGSTEEHAGFVKQNTATGIAGLTEFAIQMCPVLAEARFERSWAGLRPHGRDDLPYLGRAPGFENVFVACGHFRAGLQLSPITGVMMADLIEGKPPRLPLEPYACERGLSDGEA